MSNNYIFPIERPLSGGTFDFCDGPGGRWAVWVASAGIRYGRWNGEVLDDSLGQPNPVFISGERPSKVSMCFDWQSNLLIAIQKDAATIEIKSVSPGDLSISTGITADNTLITADSNAYTADETSVTQTIDIQDVTFPGLSPVLCFNGKGIADQTQSDAVIFYLKTDGLAIFARFERDSFGVEYQINSGIPSALASLLKADVLNIGGTWYQCLWAITKDGRQVFFRSALFPIAINEMLSVDGALVSGSYFVPTTIPIVTETLTIDGTLKSGSYIQTVETMLTPGDLITVDGSLSLGSYGDMSLPKLTPGDLITENATLGPGNYA